MASRAFRIASAILVLCCASAFAHLPQVREQIGRFALYGLRRQIVSVMRLVGNNALDLVQYPLGSKHAIRDYLSVDGAPVHVFLVRDDFRSFSHVHPQLRSDGHFIVRVALDQNHRYYTFVDSFVAGGVGEQTFLYTLQNGSPPHHLDVSLAKPNTRARIGPYTIALSTARFRAHLPVTISVTVSRGAMMVTPPDHQSFDVVATIVNTGTLAYTSVYEGRAPGMWFPGEYDRPQLLLPDLPRGTYRMWLELRIGKAQFIAPFTLVAQ